MKESNIKEVLLLMKENEDKIKANRQNLNEYKETAKNTLTQIIEKEIDTTENSQRLQNFLEKTKISDLNFLYRSLFYMRGNNAEGFLTTEKLFLLNEETNNIAKSYGITTEHQLFEIIAFRHFNSTTHPLLKENQIIEALKKFKTLAYLDEFFKNIDNCLNYQGSYTTYKYVKNYLKEVLVENSKEIDEKLVYNNLNVKLQLAKENIVKIANELLTLRESIPNSRISVCNQGLKKTSKKVPNSPITFDQQIFISAIAFGTTLEKLEKENYEDAKQLLYIPYQKILK